jgi:oligopeptide transport system substrate-binding protein
VEAVIESRIGRLKPSLREILTVAAVEGESFTARVVARVREIQERQLLRSLSGELAARHRLVSERQALMVGQQMLARYRFAHALFQRYLYDAISPVERRLLHGEIAVILEEVYGDERETIAVQLGRHYLEAGDGQKAMEYLLKAGDKARHMRAHQEAIEAYRSALSLAKANQEYEKAARLLMKLGLSYSLASEFLKASETYQEAFSAWQASSMVLTYQPPSLSDQPLRLEYVAIETLDPLMAASASLKTILIPLFSGLTRMSIEGEIIPDVARRWEILDSGKIYVFHLREDVYWRDGRPVTAHDFEYAWRRLLSPDMRKRVNYLHPVRGARAYQESRQENWAEVGIHAEDAHTLTVELEEPIGYFLPITTNSKLLPVPRHVVAERGDEWATSENLISNGPFFLESWSRQGPEAMTLVRNPNYHGSVQGNVARVVLTAVSDSDKDDDPFNVVAAYESNQVDVLPLNLLRSEVAIFSVGRFGDDHISFPSIQTAYFVLNPNKPPFDNVQVRRAFAMAIDKNSFTSDLVRPMYEVAMGGFIPPGMWAHSPGISLPFNPTQARLLLREAGLTPGKDRSRIVAPYIPGVQDTVLHGIDQWRDHLGLNISAKSVSSLDELLQLIMSDPPQIYAIGWVADYRDPNNFMGDGLQRIRRMWDRPELWELIDDAGHELDQSIRLDLYRKADRILVNEAVLTPMWYLRFNQLVKPWIRNWSLSIDGSPRLENVIIEPH